jgi:glutamine amidotransferase|tara:strand:- start:23 stop:685 length:663 start_codon:yes stop_codon:yes gene_type:complete
LRDRHSLQISIIDYDSGNLRSVAKALEKYGVDPITTSDSDIILKSDAVILPGVGSAPSAMQALSNRNLIEPIKQYIALGKPFFGICLGLQLLFNKTDEGDSDCLGVISGNVRQLSSGLKVPHMGWNSIDIKKTHPILEGIPSGEFFYFVHSYFVVPQESGDITATTDYGEVFCSIYAKDNLIATQFHPEKSGDIGLRIYKNFIDMCVSYKKYNYKTREQH